MPLKGGAGLTWQNKPVAMVCFNWTAAETLYMFVLGEALPDPNVLRPQVIKNLSTVTWIADGKTFLLAGPVSESQLAQLAKS